MKSDYSLQDITKALLDIGISKGDDVFIHSNLGFFGILEGCRSGEQLCESFLTAIQSIIGDEGTIVTPTFSYSYCHNEVYDPHQTKTNCGMLSEYMRKTYPNQRTLDPNFSVCGVGKHMVEYMQCNIHEAFGKDSFWEKFMRHDGKIICMNFHAASTFIHFIECENKVDYRYNKAFNGQTILESKTIKDYAVHFVYDGADDAPCVERVTELCKENGVSKQVSLGKGLMRSFSARKYYNFFTDLLKVRPRVLCVKEELPDGK